MTTLCRLNFWKIQVLVANDDDDYHDEDDDDDYHYQDDDDDNHDEDDYHDEDDDDDYHDEIQVHNLGAFGRWRPQDFPQRLAL